MNNSKIAMVILFLISFSSVSIAGHDSQRNHYKKHKRFAKVLFVKPIYEVVRTREPHLECRSNSSRHVDIGNSHQHAPERIIMGGLLGGIIGHEFGHSGNRELTTAAGVVIGSIIAHDTSPRHYRNGYDRADYQQACRRVNHVREHRQVVGYKVRYKYRGEIFTTRTNYHPGKWLKIRSRPGKRHRY